MDPDPSEQASILLSYSHKLALFLFLFFFIILASCVHEGPEKHYLIFNLHFSLFLILIRSHSLAPSLSFYGFQINIENWL